MIATLMSITIPPLAYTIMSCDMFRIMTMDYECFLKSDDGSRVMRSDTVSIKAPDAKVGDWRMG